MGILRMRLFQSYITVSTAQAGLVGHVANKVDICSLHDPIEFLLEWNLQGGVWENKKNEAEWAWNTDINDENQENMDMVAREAAEWENAVGQCCKELFQDIVDECHSGMDCKLVNEEGWQDEDMFGRTRRKWTVAKQLRALESIMDIGVAALNEADFIEYQNALGSMSSYYSTGKVPDMNDPDILRPLDPDITAIMSEECKKGTEESYEKQKYYYLGWNDV